MNPGLGNDDGTFTCTVTLSPRGLDVFEGHRCRRDGERAGLDLVDQRRQFREVRRGRDGALTDSLKTEIRRAQGDRGKLERRTGHGPDLDPVQRPAAVGSSRDERDHGVLRWLSPQVIDHDVDVGGDPAERRRRGEHFVRELHDRVGAEVLQRGEALRVAPDTHDATGPESFGHLD